MDDRGDPDPDRETVQRLLAARRRFLAFLTRRVGEAQVAEDLLHDSLARAIERAAGPREPEAVVPWFLAALRNAAADHFRARGARPEELFGEHLGELPDELPAEADEGARRAVCACLADVVPTLRPSYAEALRRVDLEGSAVADYGREAGITANNASVRLHRARAALRGRLAALCGACAEHGCLDCTCRDEAEDEL